jgi:predicted transcriptional regulator of viral defense system
MNYLDFKQKMFSLACFNINQIYAWQPHFDRNNLTRWVKKRLLIRLKQGYYTFPEYKNKPEFSYYIANRIYKPSYISLHTALSFYGIIPEAVVQITSVTSLKTAIFKNDFEHLLFSKNNSNRILHFGDFINELRNN